MISLHFNSYKIDQIAVMDGDRLVCLVDANMQLQLTYPGDAHPSEQVKFIGSPDFVSIDVGSIPDLIAELRIAQAERPE